MDLQACVPSVEPCREQCRRITENLNECHKVVKHLGGPYLKEEECYQTPDGSVEETLRLLEDIVGSSQALVNRLTEIASKI